MSRFIEIMKEDLDRYKTESSLAKRGYSGGVIINALVVKNHILAWLYWFRYLQFGENPIFNVIAKIMLKKISRKYGIQIPVETQIGAGLYIGHGIGIVVNRTAVIGRNCNISQFTTIGSNKGKAASIGDNVYIGPGVCIVEDVKIGNNVKIGAGTVVVHDVPDNSTTVGNPNRIIIKNSNER